MKKVSFSFAVKDGAITDERAFVEAFQHAFEQIAKGMNTKMFDVEVEITQLPDDYNK
jgi:hypothetical protein